MSLFVPYVSVHPNPVPPPLFVVVRRGEAHESSFWLDLSSVTRGRRLSACRPKRHMGPPAGGVGVAGVLGRLANCPAPPRDP